MGKNPLEGDPAASNAPMEPEKVTAPVTPQTPWGAAHLTEEEWNDLDIPKFLQRDAQSPRTSTTPAPAPVRTAEPPGGGPSGLPSVNSGISGLTGGFDQFRVDPEEIESKIRHEADRRWRAWVPTKEHLTRPRKSYYEKQVRKEFYP